MIEIRLRYPSSGHERLKFVLLHKRFALSFPVSLLQKQTNKQTEDQNKQKQKKDYSSTYGDFVMPNVSYSYSSII